MTTRNIAANRDFAATFKYFRTDTGQNIPPRFRNPKIVPFKRPVLDNGVGWMALERLFLNMVDVVRILAHIRLNKKHWSDLGRSICLAEGSWNGGGGGVLRLLI